MPNPQTQPEAREDTGLGRARFAGRVVPAWRVRAVVPCYGRLQDVQNLISDLSRLDLEGGRLGLSVLLVDNASPKPIRTETLPILQDLRVLRLDENRGGSGGFSAGMGMWLAEGVQGDPHELIWLLDSDVRVDAGALTALIAAVERHPELAGVGSALVDPQTGTVFEVGGDVDSRNGELVQEMPRNWGLKGVIAAGYVAACSLMVRRTAVEAAGVMADLFISGDDVEWCYRVRERTGLGFGVAVDSRVAHPHPDKMRTVGRYYAARNAFVAMAAAGVHGRWVRFRRAMREVGRAASQVMVGRDDLAKLHLSGLRDAAKGLGGPAPAGTIDFETFQPLSELEGAIKLALKSVRGRVLVRHGVLGDDAAASLFRSLNAVCVAPDVVPASPARVGVIGLAAGLLAKLVKAPSHGVAVVSARGRVDDWMAGRVIVTVASDGFCVRRVGRVDRGWALARTLGVGVWRAARVAVRGQIESAGARLAAGTSKSEEPTSMARGATVRPTLSIVILSHNRWGALEKTLTSLRKARDTAAAEIVVVDNASTDGTTAKVREKFPEVRLVALKRNLGVGGFNEGVRASSGEAVLILDDDSWPADGVMDAALDLLTKRPEIAAVSLHPCHPATRASEWAFVEQGAIAEELRERWPVMGCGNLVRRTAWDRVGGYEESFFLYRNDVDLALKLIGSGHRVFFDPEWVVWHDSAAGAGGGKKSVRWFELASRNWVWMCRRHGRGWETAKALLAGWVWAHRLARWSPWAHAAVVRGVASGLVGRRPRLPRGTRRGEMGRFLRARMGG